MKQTQQIPNPHLGWIILNSFKINSIVRWIHDMDVKCNISSIQFPLHIFIQNWNLYQRSLLINIAQSSLYVPLIQFEIWNTWEINLAAFTHDTLSLLPFWHWFKSVQQYNYNCPLFCRSIVSLAISAPSVSILSCTKRRGCLPTRSTRK